jgi:hypothetical protein
MRKLTLSLLSVAAVLLVSCDKDETDCACSPVEQLPTTYNFENVDHSGQDQRLDMLSEISSYVKTSNNGQAIDEAQVLNMLTNQGYTWSKGELNSSTKQIADKYSDEGGSTIGGWVKDLEQISQNPGTGSNGTAGLVQNAGGTKQYLFDANGYELAQLIEKGSMGALAYYQATSVYLASSKMNVDNETVEPGKGTEMQHHWDEAFGYWGVPANFGSAGFNYDENAEYHRFWAKYFNAVDEHLSVNSSLMKSFIKGRVAINNKDYTTRDAAIAEIRETWELVSAAMAIHYLNGAKADLADDALRNHQLSEAVGFIWSLKFNAAQKLSDVQIQDLIDNNLNNLYNVSVADLNTVKDVLANTYNLNDVKDKL